MSENGLPQAIDVTGSTPEEAIEKGLSQLGLTRNDVIVEIIEEGRGGLAGIGAREAVVRLIPLRAPHPAPAESEEDTAEEAEVAHEVLADLLERMRVEATIYVYRAEPASPEEIAPWVLDIQGPDLGILIGRRGETLSALQYLTRLITSRRLERRANIVVDVEGYKSRREVSLRRLAQQMAAEARRRGRTVTLEPMPPNERRIIHIALRDDETVTTESVGEGEHRRVTIIPLRRSEH